MPLLPIFMKMIGSAAMRGAGRIGMARIAGTGFAQNYTMDFAEGVKRGMKREINGMADGQGFVAYAQAGLKKLFYDLPKAIGQRRWGEHMAGALVKVTSERLATMNAALATYGGGAHTYAQSMTSLADKAFKLGFGEAGWLSQVMKYTRGEYDPFGTGPTGLKTKEENFNWFKDRYDGRKDLVDEARTVGGILGLTPDIIKMIIDGHRDLLERGNHLTTAQIKASTDLEFQTRKTQMAWQEVADIWGAKTAGFWETWEKGKEKAWGWLADLGREKKTDEEIDKYVGEVFLGKINNIAKSANGKGALQSSDVSDVSIWKNLTKRGYLKTLSDEELNRIARKIGETGEMSEGEARERIRMARGGRGYMMNTSIPLDPEARERAAKFDEDSLAISNSNEGFWGGLKNGWEYNVLGGYNGLDPRSWWSMLMAAPKGYWELVPQFLGGTESNVWDSLGMLYQANHDYESDVEAEKRSLRGNNIWGGIRFHRSQTGMATDFLDEEEKKKFYDRVRKLNEKYNSAQLKKGMSKDEVDAYYRNRANGLSNEEAEKLLKNPLKYAPSINPYEHYCPVPHPGVAPGYYNRAFGGGGNQITKYDHSQYTIHVANTDEAVDIVRQIKNGQLTGWGDGTLTPPPRGELALQSIYNQTGIG